MGVFALTFFDPRSSRGPQGLLESAIWKNAYLALEPKRFEILIFAASVTPIISDFKGGHSNSTFWSKVIQGYLWGKMLKMRGLSRQTNIGLQVFSDLQKKIIFATAYKFQRALSWQNFEFCP